MLTNDIVGSYRSNAPDLNSGSNDWNFDGVTGYSDWRLFVVFSAFPSEIPCMLRKIKCLANNVKAGK
jgi:hypothetical protein